MNISRKDDNVNTTPSECT